MLEPPGMMDVPTVSGEIFGIPRILRNSSLIRACTVYNVSIYRINIFLHMLIKIWFACRYIYIYLKVIFMRTLIKVQWLSDIGHQPSPPWLCPAALAQMEMIHGIKNISKEGVRRYEAMGGSWRLGCRVW